MLELSIKEKERIGKLLKYYRKKNKVQWKEIKQVLSTSTYSNMEKGKAYKDNYLYELAFSIYDLHYQNKYDFELWLCNYMIHMNDILENYKEEDFNSLRNELNDELGPYRNSTIYEQYYQVIVYILNYYKYSKYMTMEEIEDCFRLFECIDFEETIMIYLIEVMFFSNNNSINNYFVFEKLNLYISKYNYHPIIWYIEAISNKLSASFETALEILNKSYNYYEEKGNKYRLAKSLMGKYIIYKNIDYKKAEETAKKLIQLKKENFKYESMIHSINFNIGVYYYLNNQYEKASELFLENTKKYRIKRDWIYLCACYTQMNLEIPSEIHVIENDNSIESVCISYFQLKQKKSKNKVLVDYIMKTLIPNVLNYEKFRQPLWKMYEEELLKISEKDKRYADTFVQYMQIENKMCKNR